MADLISLGGVGSAIGSIGQGIMTGFTWFLIFLPVIIGFVLILYFSSFKHVIILRKRTKDKTDVVIVTKFKIVKKKGRPTEIKTQKLKLILPIPPELAKDITEKGKLFVECYLTDSGEATWIKVTAKISTQKVKKSMFVPVYDKSGHIKTDKGGQEIHIYREQEVLEEIELTRLKTEDKDFYFNRERLLNEKYKLNNVWTFLNQHAGTLAFIIFLAMIFVFWGDIMQPAIEMAKANQGYNAQSMAKWDQILDSMDQLINERQVFEAEQQFNVTKPAIAPE